MVKVLLNAIVGIIATMVTKENLKLVADKMLDAVEDVVQDSTNTIDDALVLPVVKKLRETFDIPDNDEPPAPE